MQTIGKISSEILQEQSESIGNTANLPAKSSPIRGGGLETAGTKTNTALARSRQGEIAEAKQVSKVAAWTRSVSLWRINQDDPKIEEALFYLKEMFTPITYEEAAVELGRFLQHYPRRRHIEQDAVFIQDIADELELAGYGLPIVVVALREIRNEYTEGNPWLPQTGYILHSMNKKQKYYEDHYKRLTTPKRVVIEKKTEEVKKEPRKKWSELTDEEQQGHIRTLKKLTGKIAKAYRRAFDIPDSVEVSA